MTAQNSRYKSDPARRGITRTKAVWSALLASTGGLTVLLWALDGRPAPDLSDARPAALRTVADPTPTVNISTEAPREWGGIVIHHSGHRFDTIESIEQRHHAAKLASIGYHFVIGNGSGLNDGEVVATERWTRQQPGAHTSGPEAGWYNRNTIGICLVGDGERERFTPAQIDALTALVAELRNDRGLAADEIVLHREVAHVVSPGRWFPSASFRERLRPGG
ncbi:MAG: peptidoglycan recognition family protein [Planctomycetota bacterium]